MSAAVPGCLQNHDILAERGTGGASNAGAGGKFQTPTDGGGGSAIDEDAPSGPAEPDGPRVLTLVHGVVDAPIVGFCFAAVKKGVEATSGGVPQPAGGLGWGRTAPLDGIPGVDLATDSVRVYVVAVKDALSLARLYCPDVVALAHAPTLPPPEAPPDASTRDAGGGRDGSVPGARDASVSRPDATTSVDASVPGIADAAIHDAAADAAEAAAPPVVPVPDVRAAALAVLPAGQLAASRSYVLVASGCLGGPGVTHPSASYYCGDAYASQGSTLTPVVVAASRITEKERLSLAFLNAAIATARYDLRLVPGLQTDIVTIAEDVVPGQLAPRPPDTSTTVEDLLPGGAEAKIRLYPNGGTDPAYDETWAQTIEAGDVTGLANGSSYTLVYVGPYPTFRSNTLFNGPLVTLVKN